MLDGSLHPALMDKRGIMKKPVLTCLWCGEVFTISEAAFEEYPDWRPRLCLKCKRENQNNRKAMGLWFCCNGDPNQ
jgi:hypothetical protein